MYSFSYAEEQTDTNVAGLKVCYLTFIVTGIYEDFTGPSSQDLTILKANFHSEQPSFMDF